VTGNQKGGSSGVLVDLLGSDISKGSLNNAEFTVTNPLGVSQVTADFTVRKSSSVTLSFQDDPNPALANQSLSSNISIDHASLAGAGTEFAGVAGSRYDIALWFSGLAPPWPRLGIISFKRLRPPEAPSKFSKASFFVTQTRPQSVAASNRARRRLLALASLWRF